MTTVQENLSKTIFGVKHVIHVIIGRFDSWNPEQAPPVMNPRRSPTWIFIQETNHTRILLVTKPEQKVFPLKFSTKSVGWFDGSPDIRTIYELIKHHHAYLVHGVTLIRPRVMVIGTGRGNRGSSR